MVQQGQEDRSPLLPSISREGNKGVKTARSSPGSLEGDKGTFVLKASFQMSWGVISPWPSEASGVPGTRPRGLRPGQMGDSP